MNDHTFKELINKYHQDTFLLNPKKRITDFYQAEDFVNKRGFIFFWPVRGFNFPSLWVATAGNRPVPNEHDEPGHITWKWKDQALGMNIWHYAKIIKLKATIISLEILPYFYTISKPMDPTEEDVPTKLFYEGKLSLDEKIIYEAIRDSGPMHTIELKQIHRHLIQNSSESRFHLAMGRLQANFNIMPIGIAEVGSWRYAFIYNLTNRQFPGLYNQTRYFNEYESREKLLELFFLSMGCGEKKEISRFFGWADSDSSHAIASLEKKRFIKKYDGDGKDTFILTKLV